MTAPVIVGLNAVIAAVTDETPRILTVQRPARTFGPERTDAGGEVLDALPFGPLDPEHDRTLDLGLRRWVREQTGIELGYIEQLYTFGDRDREWRAAAHVLSIAYLALVRQVPPAAARDASWQDWYSYFPWEDWRAGRPDLIEREIAPGLDRWATAVHGLAAAQRRERAEIAFGLRGAPWDPDRVLDRYELLYEAGLVPEAVRDAGGEPRLREAGNVGTLPAGRRPPGPHLSGRHPPVAGPHRPDPSPTGPRPLGRPMALDHRRIAATALGRLRGKIRYRPVVFELLPPTFTLLQLQLLVEALAGVRLHKQNFRRLVERGRLVEGTGKLEARTGGRPAELFRFRREVLRERPAPGVGLPGRRASESAGDGVPVGPDTRSA